MTHVTPLTWPSTSVGGRQFGVWSLAGCSRGGQMQPSVNLAFKRSALNCKPSVNCSYGKVSHTLNMYMFIPIESVKVSEKKIILDSSVA